MKSKLTTAEAAQRVGIDRITLQRWIRDKKVKAPMPVLRKGRGVRLWSRTDMAVLQQTKEKIHRKGRGRKPKAKRRK